MSKWDILSPDHPDRQPPEQNPYDRTSMVPEDADLEAFVGESEVDDQPAAREAALIQKRVARDLTGSEGWSMLAKYVQEQVENRTDKLVLQPVKAENIEEANFIRGEIAFGRMLLVYVRQMAETADATLELFRAAEKNGDNGSTFKH